MRHAPDMPELKKDQPALRVNRVGVRLSPYGIANGSGEADPMPLYTHVIRALDALGLAYLHFIEPRSSGAGRAEVNWQNVPSAIATTRLSCIAMT